MEYFGLIKKINRPQPRSWHLFERFKMEEQFWLLSYQLAYTRNAINWNLFLLILIYIKSCCLHFISQSDPPSSRGLATKALSSVMSSLSCSLSFLCQRWGLQTLHESPCLLVSYAGPRWISTANGDLYRMVVVLRGMSSRLCRSSYQDEAHFQGFYFLCLTWSII